MDIIGAKYMQGDDRIEITKIDRNHESHTVKIDPEKWHPSLSKNPFVGAALAERLVSKTIPSLQSNRDVQKATKQVADIRRRAADGFKNAAAMCKRAVNIIGAAAMCEKAAEMHEKVGDLSEAAVMYETAADNIAKDNPSQAVEMYAKAAQMYKAAGNQSKSFEMYKKSALIYKTASDNIAKGNPSQAAEMYKKSAEMYEAAAMPLLAAAMHKKSGAMYEKAGNPYQAAYRYEDVAEIYKKAGNLSSKAAEMYGKAAEMFHKDNFPSKAAEMHNKAAEIYYKAHDVPNAVASFQNAADMYMEARCFKLAAPLYKLVVDMGGPVAEMYEKEQKQSQAAKMHEKVAHACEALSRSYIDSNNYEAAAAMLDKVDDHIEAAAGCLCKAAEMCANNNSTPSEAAEMYGEAAMYCKKNNYPFQAAEMFKKSAEMYAKANNQSQSVEMYEMSAIMYEKRVGGVVNNIIFKDNPSEAAAICEKSAEMYAKANNQSKSFEMYEKAALIYKTAADNIVKDNPSQAAEICEKAAVMYEKAKNPSQQKVMLAKVGKLKKPRTLLSAMRKVGAGFHRVKDLFKRTSIPTDAASGSNIQSSSNVVKEAPSEDLAKAQKPISAPNGNPISKAKAPSVNLGKSWKAVREISTSGNYGDITEVTNLIEQLDQLDQFGQFEKPADLSSVRARLQHLAAAHAHTYFGKSWEEIRHQIQDLSTTFNSKAKVSNEEMQAAEKLVQQLLAYPHLRILSEQEQAVVRQNNNSEGVGRSEGSIIFNLAKGIAAKRTQNLKSFCATLLSNAKTNPLKSPISSMDAIYRIKRFEELMLGL